VDVAQAPTTSCAGRGHYQRLRTAIAQRAPKGVFSDLVRFVEQPVDAPRIERAMRFSSFDELSKQEKDGGFVEARPDGTARFLRAGKVGVWRKRLSKQQVARLVEVHGPVMRRLGYLTEDLKIAV